MFNLSDWLDSEITIHGRFNGPTQTKRGRWLAYLYFANGASFEVNGWGSISNGGPRGHRLGLEMEEAMQLMQMSSFLDGLFAMGCSPDPVKNCLREYDQEMFGKAGAA